MSKGNTKEVIELLKQIGAVNKNVQDPIIYEKFAVSIESNGKKLFSPMTCGISTCRKIDGVP